jgi:O-antigen ligase
MLADRSMSLSRIAGWSLPVTVVLVFVKGDFQPSFKLHGSTVASSDLLIAVTLLLALWRLWAGGLAVIGRSLPLWSAAAAFVLFVGAASLYPRLSDSHYDWSTHLVTAVKFAEYALLAPATALLVQGTRELRRLAATVAGLALVAAVVGVAQFCGAHIFEAWPPGSEREPSFVGLVALGALGVASLAVGVAELLAPGTVGRRTMAVALAAGAVSVVISGDVAAGVGLAGVVVGALAVALRRSLLTRRTGAVLASLTIVCALGLAALRGGDIAQFGRFAGILPANTATKTHVQTYAQRTLMYYIALRVFEAHPLLGAGWQSTREQQVYSPFLAAAHREFPGQPAQAFPAPSHTWAIDDAYLQALAELGLVGTALFLTLLGTGVWTGLGRSARAAPQGLMAPALGLMWLLGTMGDWAGQGLDIGIGLTALPWLGIGLIATAWPDGAPSAAAAT